MVVGDAQGLLSCGECFGAVSNHQDDAVAGLVTQGLTDDAGAVVIECAGGFVEE